jgi:hypothetical protein
VSTPRESAIRAVQTFALELLRSPLHHSGHADGWQRVARATTFEELLLGLGYAAGYAACARITSSAGSTTWRIADALDNAAKTFAALLRAHTPIDVTRCVRAYRAELFALLALEARGKDARAVP